MNADETRTFLHEWVEEVWHNKHLERIDTAMAPNYVVHSPGAPDFHGPEGFRQFVLMFQTAFPDLRFTIEDIVVEGDRVAWRVMSDGTHNGPFMGIPPTGRHGGVQTIIMSRIKDGQFQEDWVLTDMLGLLQQLGVIPAPSAPPA